MTTQLFEPGPTFIWVGTGASGAYQFLGYTESPVECLFRGAFQDIIADFGGPTVPVDSQWNGEDALTSFTLLKYDEAVMTSILTRVPGLTPGSSGAQGVGTLMVTESVAYNFFIYSPYSAKSVYGNLIKGYTFGASWLNDDYGFSLGITPKKPRCIMRSIPVWNMSTLTYTLYSNSLPSPLPTRD